MSFTEAFTAGRLSLLLSVLSGMLACVTLSAQSPDMSGTWEMDTAKSHVADGRALLLVIQSAEKKIKVYPDYAVMLRDNPAIEAVVIALPLHLHAKVAIDCMRIGKDRGRPIHVLCEKLMAWNIDQCKGMIRVAKQTDRLLAIGHQRHYNLLYAQAVELP